MLSFHCHFHQPPRENPYTGIFEIEESAFPFKNWNERIFRESYLAHMFAHEKDSTEILPTFSLISFNFSHTLLSWLISEREWYIKKLKEFSQNAIACGFNHTILALDPPEDKKVQIVWGIRAFEKVFGIYPEGFWLPELAVDKKSLSILVEEGISWIILAPHQVNKGSGYLRYKTQSGEIDIFVYDAELSHGVAFGKLLKSADEFCKSISHGKGFSLIALDGETFGHHHKFSELWLHRVLKSCPYLKTLKEVRKLLKPSDCDINEMTSWSCVHGVERWKSDCGCSTGGEENWHQKWREPLRKALEYLRSYVKKSLFEVLEGVFKDPYEALLDYVDVIMGVDAEEFIKKHQKRKLKPNEKIKALKMLGAYKFVSYAFSSDGWFFAELSGIETVRNLLFAKRAIDLLEAPEIEREFLKIISEAQSNIYALGGLEVWQKLVLKRVIKEEQIAFFLRSMIEMQVFPPEGRFGYFEYKIKSNKIALKNRLTLEKTVLEADEVELPEELLWRLSREEMMLYDKKLLEALANSNLKGFSDYAKGVLQSLEFLRALREKNYERANKMLKALEIDFKRDNAELLGYFIDEAIQELYKKPQDVDTLSDLVREFNAGLELDKRISMWHFENFRWMEVKNERTTAD
ncbi:MAG: DUF3536 domain-containing protein [Aquificaceae bacterium]